MANNTNTIHDIHNYNIDIENREIYLHSYILDAEDEPGTDYRSAILFEKNLRYLNLLSLEPILIHMHLPGGDWEDCMGIYDAIKKSKAKTIILAYAKVQSASSVIFQAPDIRILMPNVNMLIHYGTFGLTESDHSRTPISHTKWHEQESAKMVDIFTESCMVSELAKNKNWRKMIAKKHIISQLNNKGDWILTSDEAVYYGFADGILGSKKYPNIDYVKTLIKKLK